MTIPEIRAALNELHERACKAEALLERAENNINELRAQIGVEREAQPAQPYEMDKPVNTIGGGSLLRSTRY